MSAYTTILLEVDPDGIATLTFNRPEVRNAMNRAMVDECHAALDELAARGDVRALLFTGAGEKAFVGGADIAELRERGRLDALRRINAQLYRRIEQFAAEEDHASPSEPGAQQPAGDAPRQRAPGARRWQRGRRGRGGGSGLWCHARALIHHSPSSGDRQA